MTAHRTAGAFAEYVTAAQASTALVSAGLDLATAGALDLAGTATLSATGAIDPLPGETVLISGAAVSVGGFAAQLAAARGAYVVDVTANFRSRHWRPSAPTSRRAFCSGASGAFVTGKNTCD
jgi:NADPH:quinone reductase-like Zn-dependent oxidoreductase